MNKTTIQNPPKQIEDKELSFWINSVHSALKSIDIRIKEIEKYINIFVKKKGNN